MFAITSDGRTLVKKYDRELQVLRYYPQKDLSDYRLDYTINTYDFQYSSFDISPDGHHIAMTTHDLAGMCPDGMSCTDWHLFETDAQQFIPRFIKHGRQILKYQSYYAFATDGYAGGGSYDGFFLNNQLLVTISDMGEVYLWNYRKHKLVFSWTAAAQRAHSTAFTNKLGYFAMSEAHVDHAIGGKIGHYKTRGNWVNLDNDKWRRLRRGAFLRLWDLHSGTVIREFDYENTITNLSFDPTDRWLAGYDETLHKTIVWSVDGHQYAEITGKPSGFSIDKPYLLIQQDNMLQLWDWQQHQVVDKTLSLPYNIITAKITSSNMIIVSYAVSNDDIVFKRIHIDDFT